MRRNSQHYWGRCFYSLASFGAWRLRLAQMCRSYWEMFHDVFLHFGCLEMWNMLKEPEEFVRHIFDQNQWEPLFSFIFVPTSFETFTAVCESWTSLFSSVDAFVHHCLWHLWINVEFLQCDVGQIHSGNGNPLLVWQTHTSITFLYFFECVYFWSCLVV